MANAVTKVRKPSDYKHIRAWGERMHSFEYYIANEQEKACRANQPVDVIYERYADDGSGPTGVWERAGDIKNKDLRDAIERRVQQLQEIQQ